MLTSRFLARVCPMLFLAVLAAAAHAQVGAFTDSWPTLGAPLGLALDGGGNVLVTSDAGAGAPAYSYSSSGTLLAQFGTGPGIEAYGVAVAPGGDVFVTDYYNRRVLRFASAGAFLNEWNTGGSLATFLAMDGLGNLYVTDTSGNMVRKFSSSGSLLGQWSSNRPVGIAFAGGVLYVASREGGTVSKYLTDGTPLGSFPTGASAAEQLTIGGDGRLYLADWGSSRLLIFALNGTPLGSLGSSVAGYAYGPVRYDAVAIASDGTIFVGDYDHNRVLRFARDLTSAQTISWGGLKARYR
jgi:DNA-binding beta-propeller fold protein YncE